MAVSFFTPSRTIALITDEALCLYTSGMKGVRMVEIVPWDAEDFERNVAGVLSRDCGSKPVLILNDMVEISFRKERIPRLNPLDKNNVINRKLNLAFPSYPVKAALPLKEKIAKTDKSVAAAVYIFAAVPASPALTKTIAAVSRALVPIVGFGLLPAESSDLVKTLALRQKQKNKNAWSIFIGQHANGGLRQIVTKNGELALTRMTPVTDMNTDPKAWLRDVTQEFKATMSYLTRFGYAQDDGLNVFVIGNKELGESLESLLGVTCTYSALTVAEAAKILNVPLGRQGEQNYADILHVAWAGRKGRLLLPMHSITIDDIAKPRKIAKFAALGLCASGLFFAYQAYTQHTQISAVTASIDTAAQNKAQLDVQYQKEVQRKDKLGFDVVLIQSSLRVYDNLQRTNVDLMKVFWALGDALGHDLKLDKVFLKRTVSVENEEGIDEAGNAIDLSAPKPEEPPPEENAGANGAEKEEKGSTLYEASLIMTFPSTTDILQGNEQVKDFRDRIQKNLPKDKVEVVKFLKDYEYTNQIVVETGKSNKGNVSQDFIVELKLKGDLP